LLLKACHEAAQRKKHSVKPQAAAAAIDPTDSNALIEQMLAQSRYALLLRAQLAENLSERHFAQALAALGERMALVPDGEVALEETASPRVVAVQRLFLDRFPGDEQGVLRVRGGGRISANVAMGRDDFAGRVGFRRSHRSARPQVLGRRLLSCGRGTASGGGRELV